MKIIKKLKQKDVGAIGIGAMIVFIAMVLVAGIAASVLIQTSTKLESQAMATGSETIDEVATGISVEDIKGYCAAVTANITKMTMTVRPRAGSESIDLTTIFIELSNSDKKIILEYSDATANNWFAQDSNGVDDIFGKSVFPSEYDEFGIIVIEDADDSCTESNPVINRGDKVMLCIDTSLCFNSSGGSLGIQERTDVWGQVVAEDGSPGVVSFTAPAAFPDKVIDLQ